MQFIATDIELILPVWISVLTEQESIAYPATIMIESCLLVTAAFLFSRHIKKRNTSASTTKSTIFFSVTLLIFIVMSNFIINIIMWVHLGSKHHQQAAPFW